MPFCTYWFTSLLLVLAIVTAAHVPHPPSSRQQTPAVDLDIIYLGPNVISYNGYTVSGCGNVDEMPPKINLMLGFLYQMKPHLEKVIEDAQQGTNSQHGYTAFFKSNTNIPRVTAAYQKLIDAYPVIVSEARSKIINRTTAQPIFHCINETDPETKHVLEQCNRGYEYGPSHQTPVVITPGTEILLVCPTFFELAQYPPSARICPSLGPDGKFKSEDMSLLKFVFPYIVYALVTMYDRALYETYHDFKSLQDMQYAVELNKRQSMLNAASYGFYAGAVQGKCTKFPKTKGREGELR